MSIQQNQFNKVVYNHRMYENEYPDIDDIVMCKPISIEESSFTVQLLEYGSIEGMLLFSNLSKRRRIRSIRSIITLDRNIPLQVLDIDNDKGYINLSKKLVESVDIGECKKRYGRSKTVHNIIGYVSIHSGVDMDYIYQKVVWPLLEDFDSAYDAFKNISEDKVNINEIDEIDEKLKTLLLKQIKKHLNPPKFKLTTNLEITCFSFDGVLGIKESLLVVQRKFPNIQIRLTGSPKYSFSFNCKDKEHGLKVLHDAVVLCQKTLAKYNGRCTVKSNSIV